MVIESRQQLEKVSVAELSVGDTSVAPASTARNLGVLFDPNLKFDAQITKTCCTGYYYLHNTRKIGKYFNVKFNQMFRSCTGNGGYGALRLLY